MLKFLRLLSLALIVASAGALPAAAGDGQEAAAPLDGTPPDPGRSLSKEELQMKLQLDEAILRLQESEREVGKTETELREAVGLQGKGIFTSQEVSLVEERYNRALKDREQAKIDLEKTKLGFFQNASHIEVVSAVKYPRPNGTKGVRLVLRNASDLEQISLADTLAGGRKRTDEQLEALLRIENVRVALLLDNTVVARPYEASVERMPYESEHTLDFLLFQDTDRLTVSVRFLGRDEATSLFLETEAAEDRVAVESVRFSQEGPLESEVVFDISLERLLEEEKSFRLSVFELPRDYEWKFLDEQQAAVNRVRFGRGTTVEKLNLEIAVPGELPAEALDREVRFYAAIGDEAAFERLKALREPDAEGEPDGTLPIEQALQEAGLGYEALTLIPRGVGALELNAANTYAAMPPDGSLELDAELENTGTLPLAGVELDLRGPRSWTLTAEPARDIRLGRGETVLFKIRVQPKEAPAVGDYEIRATARCRASGKLIESGERVFRIRVEGQEAMGPTLVVLGVLAGLMLLALALTLRMSRR